MNFPEEREYEGWSRQREQHDLNNSSLLENTVGRGEKHKVHSKVSKGHIGSGYSIKQ